MTAFHNRMMNIQCHYGFDGITESERLQFRAGHREARHAAAEIANEADALIAELYEALRQIGACEYDQRSDSGRLDRIFTIVRRFTVAKASN